MAREPAEGRGVREGPLQEVQGRSLKGVGSTCSRYFPRSAHLNQKIPSCPLRPKGKEATTPHNLKDKALGAEVEQRRQLRASQGSFFHLFPKERIMSKRLVFVAAGYVR